MDFCTFSSLRLRYLSSTDAGNIGTCSLLNIDFSLSLMLEHGCVSVRWVGKEREPGREGGGGKERRRGWEVVEHCSADELMQQSRLSQQHTPSLAQCLHRLEPLHGYLGDRLPRSRKKREKRKNHQKKDPSFSDERCGRWQPELSSVLNGGA